MYATAWNYTTPSQDYLAAQNNQIVFNRNARANNKFTQMLPKRANMHFPCYCCLSLPPPSPGLGSCSTMHNLKFARAVHAHHSLHAFR
jgi:hypothetical protein